ncbi:MAG: hypothetical protein WB773_26260, partial [Isosphaeraceae bacterium]
EFTEKYSGFRGSLFSIHPLSGCERLLRDEWRELPLSRVDEIQEESEIGVKSKLPFLPRAAILRTKGGQN